MQAGTVHVDELQLHLCGSHSVYISFSKILLARARSLNHLIYRPVSYFKVLMSEIERDVVDAFRFLEGL
jgi:hypothetical protein